MLVVAALVFISFQGIPGAMAQTALERASDIKTPVEEVIEDANTVAQTITILERLTDGTTMDDESLVGAQVKYQGALTTINDLIRQIDEQSATIAARLTEIGPPPDDETVVEPRTVTETRAQLNNDKSSLAVTKTELEKLKLAAQNEINNITKDRQNAFTEAIAKQTDISNELISDGANGISVLVSSVRSHFTNWFAFAVSNKFWAMIGSTLVSLSIALFLSFNFNRYFKKTLDREAEDPDYFTRVFTAFWATVLPSAATAIFFAATYSLYTQFDVLTGTTAQIVLAVFLLAVGLVFGWNLCRAILAPSKPNWRLTPTGDRTSKRLFWLILSLGAVYGVDSAFTTLNSALSGPLSLTILRGLVASILIGLILIAMAVVIARMRGTRTDAMHAAEHDGPAEDEMAHEPITLSRRNASLLLVVALAISGVVLIVAALLGYIGFARFLSRQLVVTGGIVAIMLVGFIAARELAREGVLANTQFGRRLIARGYAPHKIEQASLGAGGTLIALILAFGIPAILMQWGTRLEEITAFAKRAFFGIDVGNIRISLSGILIGIAIFGIILGITRLFQRWLGVSVFPRSNIDPGVSDSIKAGIGYVGFALAALLAITSAGFDLSSLAIVAGALSLGIGFGLQNIVSNFVSGLILLVERPIKVGDWIVVGAAEGTVKRISVRATEIETFQKQSIIVPNSELINSQVGNWTFKSKNGRADIDVGIAYGSDIRLAEKILYEIAHEHAMVQKKPEPSVWFVSFGASSLDLRLRMFLYDIGNVVTVETEVRLQILERYEKAGIEIPFPQQDVHLKLPTNSTPPLEEQIKKATRSRTTKAKPRKPTQPG